MKEKRIYLERDLDSQQKDLLLQRLFNGSNVPEYLAGAVRRFQEERITQGIESKLNLKKSLVKRCELQIGTIHFDLRNLDEEKVENYLKASAQEEKVVNKEEVQESGQLEWQFTGINQFGSITIRVRDRSWQVEFSRLQRRISSFITTETSLKPKAHQALYHEMKKILHPIASSEPSQLLILQGAPGLGKSHCVEHYFYHDANQNHQIVAWLSGESKTSFLDDWKALANQLRYIEFEKRNSSDEEIIHHWCEKQLGQWLLIIDDVQVEIEWLKQYLPQKGGHVLITTSMPSYRLPEEATLLSFSSLSCEDSALLLKAWLGEYWDASGYEKEEQALAYLSQALSGSPALLAQMALLARKKGLSFDRIKSQFEEGASRHLLLTDTVFDQLEGQTFNNAVEKSLKHIQQSFQYLYPQQLTLEKGDELLRQFIVFLKQDASEIEKTGQCTIDDEALIQYWAGMLMSLSLIPDIEKIREILKLLPFTYDSEKKTWVIALASLHLLELSYFLYDSLNMPATLQEPERLDRAEQEPANLPSGINLTMHLNDSGINAAEIAILTVDKLSLFKAWRLPTTNPYFIPRPKLTEEIKTKLPNKSRNQKTAELILAAASGMGGIGKTELARHFITSSELVSHYERRFWINAASYAQLRSEFYDLASYLGLIEPKEYIEDKELIHRLHGWFNINPGWLIIVDNADEYNSIAEWIPKEGGSVLVTTREPNPGTLQDEQIVRVPLLTEDEAITWLYQLAQRDQNRATQSEQETARRLVKDLGYLPLAIAQAAAYLREQKGFSIEEYQQNLISLLLNEESPAAQQEGTIDRESDAYLRRVVASTWKLSLKAIKAYTEKRGIPNLSPYLLAACSYLASKDIPTGLLERWLNDFFELGNITPQHLSYLLDEYVGQLYRYSLCERAPTANLFSIHRLVQEVARNQLKEIGGLTFPSRAEQDSSQNKPSFLLVPLMSKVFSAEKQIEQQEDPSTFILSSIAKTMCSHSKRQGDFVEDIIRRRKLVDHINQMIHHWQMTEDSMPTLNKDETYGLLHQKLAVLYFQTGDNLQSKAAFENTLGVLNKVGDRNNYRYHKSLNILGRIYNEIGEFDKAKNAYNEIVSTTIHSTSDKITLLRYGALNGLGVYYWQRGNYELAEEKLKECLNYIVSNIGEESEPALKIFQTLSAVYESQNRLTDSITYAKHAVNIAEKKFSEKSVLYATTLQHLGFLYSKDGDYTTGMRLIKKAIVTLIPIMGIKSTDMVRAYSNLSACYYHTGQERIAVLYLAKAFELSQEITGASSLSSATIASNIGVTLLELGYLNQAEHYLNLSLINHKKIFDNKPHYQMGVLLSNFATLHAKKGELDKTIKYAQEALKIFEFIESERDILLVNEALHKYRSLYSEKRENIDFYPQFEANLNLEESLHSLNEESPLLPAEDFSLIELESQIIENITPEKTEEEVINFIEALEEQIPQGNSEGMISFYEALIKILRVYCIHHSYILRKLNELGTLYINAEEYEKAIFVFEKALQESMILYGMQGRESFAIYQNLAGAFLVSGNTEDALKCYCNLAATIEFYYSPLEEFKFDFATLLSNIGQFFEDIHRTKEAALFYNEARFIRKTLRGEHHPDTLRTKTSYLRCSAANQKQRLQEKENNPFIEKLITQLMAIQRKIKEELSVGSPFDNTLILKEREEPRISYSINDKEEYKLFRRAAAEGKLKLVEHSCEVIGVDINAADNNPRNQRTALHWACIGQHQTTIQYLLSKDARFDIEDAKGKFAWDYIIGTSLLDLFKENALRVFIKKYSTAVKKGVFLDWEKTLRLAVINNYWADVRFLIEVKEIDINSADANPGTHYTPLHLAVIKNRPEIVRYLLSKGAKTDAMDAKQKIPSDYIQPEQEEFVALFKLSTDLTEEQCSAQNFAVFHG